MTKGLPKIVVSKPKEYYPCSHLLVLREIRQAVEEAATCNGDRSATLQFDGGIGFLRNQGAQLSGGQ